MNPIEKDPPSKASLNEQIIVNQNEIVKFAWLAGFIDGEGSIGIYRERDKRKGENYFHLRASLSIANTNKPALEKAKEIIGGGTIIEHTTRIVGHKTTYHLMLRESQLLLETLLKISSYLVIKDKQAHLVADFIDRRLSKKGRGRYNPYDEEDYQNFQLLKMFNMKGVVV